MTLSLKSRLKSQNLIIKVWFLPLISLSFQTLTRPYSVNIKIYKGFIFRECSLPYEWWLEKSKSQKNDFSWVFTERVTIINTNYEYYVVDCILSLETRKACMISLLFHWLGSALTSWHLKKLCLWTFLVWSWRLHTNAMLLTRWSYYVSILYFALQSTTHLVIQKTKNTSRSYFTTRSVDNHCIFVLV